ncbi:DHA2 family efflux MFS transporter permease subunit [Adlercreutzia mucosicola]|uniref:DHA2 family efflux MFS transporter permease subunit n=1 Tax=Adlercreutzia mucosicola TaxID=580026 RepID=UPI00054EC739|nr:DHA2 family efflux MFS transporter permease subunit [Adlercreutzia mucosicola]MCR2034082.1 DHA2 family efflux MFS transporter permease subunit [Adlercreutzia mucosicola]
MALGVGRKEMVMVGVLLVGVLLAVLNQTLLSPALPAIMADLQVDATTVQWLTSGYSLVEAVVIPLSAYLIGRFSTRQLFISAFALFTAGSLAAAIAPNFWVLLLGRVLQAACTGMSMPMVFTVILLVFPREKRGTAMGVIGLIIGFAPAVGPSVAGLLVDSVGWRALFAIVTALSVVVIVLAVAVLKNYGDFARAPFDRLSVVLSTAGLVCLLYGLSTFASSDNMIVTVALMVAGLALCLLYVRRQLRLPEPMLQVGILRTRKYATSVIIIVIVQAALMGTGVITPLYIQGVLGFSATMSGVAMLPGALIGAFMGLVSGRLFDRFGVRRVVIPGVIVAVLGASGLARLGIDSGFITLTLTYTVLVVGLQFTMTPLNTWGVNSLPNSVIQHAQGVSNTLNQVAASLGTAVLVSISALAPAVAPEAAPLEQAYLGDHMAFMTTFVLMCVAALVILFFVRDGRKGATAVVTSAQGGPEPVDYAAGFDGVTVDASRDEAIDPERIYVASDVMNRQPVCALDSATMEEVIRLMDENQTSGLPVVDGEGALVGFVSDGDVASYLGKTEISLLDSTLLNGYRYVDDEDAATRLRELLALNVMAVATRRVVAVGADTPIDEVCALFAAKRIKKVPVVRDGKLVGTLSRRNIMRSLVEAIDALEK